MIHTEAYKIIAINSALRSTTNENLSAIKRSNRKPKFKSISWTQTITVVNGL